MRRRLVAAPVAFLLLAGCAAADPLAERRSAVAAITDAANDGDVDAVRDEVADLLSVLREQVANGDLDRDESDRLRAIAERIRDGAAVLEPVESPSPTPSEEPSESPSPTPTPTPSPTPEPTEEPPSEPTEEPPPTEEEPPVVELPLDPSPTPAQVSQEGTAPSSAVGEPSPQPTA